MSAPIAPTRFRIIDWRTHWFWLVAFYRHGLRFEVHLFRGSRHMLKFGLLEGWEEDPKRQGMAVKP